MLIGLVGAAPGVAWAEAAAGAAVVGLGALADVGVG
jgi:hypothetical protein